MSTLPEVTAVCDSIRKTVEATSGAFPHAGWVAVDIKQSDPTFDVYSIHLAFGDKEEVCIQNVSLSSDVMVLQSIASILQDKSIVKVVAFAEIAAGALWKLHMSLGSVLDLRFLSIAVAGNSDHHLARLRRGVMLLPTVQAVLNQQRIVYQTDNITPRVVLETAQRLAATSNPDALKRASVASALIGEAAKQRCLTTPSAFAPSAIMAISVATNGHSSCVTCGLPAGLRGLECQGCLELQLPCEYFKQGRCCSSTCPYRHEILPCTSANSCIDHVVGFCPFTHPNEVLCQSQQRVHQECCHTPNKGCNTPSDDHNISREELTPVKPPSVQSSSSNTAPTIAITHNFKPHLSSAFPLPCKYHFTTGCSKGDACHFSHSPVPLFIPVRVDPKHKARASSQRREGRMREQYSTPTVLCRELAKGGTCARSSCAALHVPVDVAMAMVRDQC